MAGKGLNVPAIEVGKDTWFDLSFYGKKHQIRFLTGHGPSNVSEQPSGHRIREMVIEGMVKWRPRDPAQITLNISDIPALGPKKRQ